MFHAHIIPIATCFIHTLYHFIAFSGTNLLTRCHGASCLFSAVFGFRKVIKEIFSESDETNCQVPISPTRHGVQRRVGGGPRSHHTMWWRRSPPARRHVVWGASWLPLLPFGLRVHVGKIGGWVFVSSNSENISCVTFLKRKNSRKHATGTVASC